MKNMERIQSLTIIIDSTEFKKDRGLNKVELSLIKDMGAEDLIKLHIPYFVYKECSSSSIADLKNELSGIGSKLSSMEKKGFSKSHFMKIRKIETAISELEGEVEASNKELWDNFVKESKAVLHEFDEKDSIDVFEAYFSGETPFKSLKKREDIPDAFIYETIKKVSKNEKVYFLSNDNNLRKKSGDIGNVTAFKSFDELKADSEFKKLHERYDVLVFNQEVEVAKSILLLEKEDIVDAVNSYLAKITFIGVDDTLLPSDNGEAFIQAIDNASTHIDELNISFIDNKFFIPIKVNGLASVNYSIFKGDYWLYDNLPSISEELNDHYFYLEDVIPVELKKTVRIPKEEIKEGESLNVQIDEFDEIKLLWPPK